MSGMIKLTMSQSLSPYPALEPISGGSQTHSASLAQAEREIKVLQEENIKLKKELAETGSAYKQLITEGAHENFDERRVNFLKAQMIQLERQVLVLSEALSSRSATLLEVENSLAAIADLCRSYTDKNGKLGEVKMTKDDVQRLIETAESGSIKLYKNIENTNMDQLQRPVAMFDRFLRHNSHHPPTLVDVCSGNLDHLNLKHVAKLESQLSQLYRHLTLMNKSLRSVASLKPTNQKEPELNPANHDTSAHSKTANQDVPKAVYVRLGSQVSRACNMLNNITQELMVLNVLVPAAPWPALKKPFLKDITSETVMSKLRGLPRSKVTEVKQVIDSLLKALNYSNLVANTEGKALKEEVVFHQQIYHQQQQYIKDLFQSLRKGYSDFQDGTNTLICQPLREILRVYETLKMTASEDALKYFLNVFKENADNISDAVEKLSDHLQKEEGEDAISSHGEQLFSVLDNICGEHRQKRDDLLAELDLVKQQFENYENELKSTLHTVDRVSTEKEIALDKDVFSDKGNGHCLDSPQWPVEKPKSIVKSLNEKGSSSSRKEKQNSRKVSIDDEFTNVECTCGADDDSSIEQSPNANVQKDHGIPQKATTPRSKSRIAHPEKIPVAQKQSASPVINQKPPKPVKGIPQSRLSLNPTRKSSSSNENKSGETEEVRASVPSRMRKSESFSDGIRLQSASSCHDNELALGYQDNRQPSPSLHQEERTPTPVQSDDRSTPSELRPRSGSLSRLGQRSQRTTTHLEPLVGASVHKRYSSGQNLSKPWK